MTTLRWFGKPAGDPIRRAESPLAGGLKTANGNKLMKTTNWMILFLLAGGLALAGCDKPKPPATVQQGVTIDLPKLKEAFATASSPELQTAVADVARGCRYGEYSTSLAALAKLASDPGLTEPQKKIVSEVTEQIKQLAAKAPAPPAR